MKRIVFIIFFFITYTNQLFAFKRARAFEVGRNYSLSEKWIQIAKSEQQAIHLLIEHLEKSKTGKFVIEAARKKAQEVDQDIESLIVAGEGSFLDSTLVRKFSPHTPGKIDYISKSKINLNRNLNVKNALLDLIHELTHFGFREVFNPYKDEFEVVSFIKSTIEGKGGEVEAYLVECQVGKELIYGDSIGQSGCYDIYSQEVGKFSKVKAKQIFYQIGMYFDEFKDLIKQLGGEFNQFKYVSREEGGPVSSVHAVPYPIAAIKEYVEIQKRVCQNDSKRVSLLKASLLRGPPQSNSKQYSEFFQNFRKRCSVYQ
ncbi:MAG: hypothetical protein H6622_14695 [Halobacteriovoraceae bacterium]|nr:hypothetical protein [Halobacteriovoraceae bacterium]